MLRIVEGLLSAALYFFAAMAIGGLAIGVHLWFAWGLTPAKVRQAIAVMRGERPTKELTPVVEQKSDEPEEEPSYDAILTRRALEYRDLELKNKMLIGLKDELEQLKRQVEQKDKNVTEREQKLEAVIARAKQESEDAGRETVRRTLESIRPTQAKELIAEMLGRNEIDEVVRLMQGMNDSKRARIVAEFKSPEEAQKIAEVLRRLREGVALDEGSQKEKNNPPLSNQSQP